MNKTRYCSIDGCNKECKRGFICCMHRSRWNRNKSYEVKRKSPEQLQTKRNETTNKRNEKYLQENLLKTEIKCAKCHLTKETKSFYRRYLKNKSQWCISCYREYSRKSDLKNKFGITEDEYNLFLQKQNNVCAICKGNEDVKHHITNSIQKLSVDHCHKTNKIRGLLCNRCNFGIGYFKDSIDLLRNAIKYLEN